MKHEKELVIAGFSISALLRIVLKAQDDELCRDIVPSLTEKLEKEINNTKKEDAEQLQVSELENHNESDEKKEPTKVKRFIRNLPDGWKASLKKQEEALKYNITLKENQTWVDDYIRNKGDCQE